ncbi:nuclear fragile X mental retardation-interacting protein 1 [Drosophila mauritiana]|uniref:Nuclear fragile X mental retardation-interacting protein 1 n=1 Tax=Drosophila mauritiana TaxID=7226 RepID=A0A6P8JUM3_DROMA|nr:nuclear fragile X mental retardation-interacting protein 1 [Drosophila mauritiana]
MEEKVLPKFVLPSPKFGKPNGSTTSNHLYLTPSGMTLLPRSKQPPPMYGARGSTVPAKYLHQEQSSPVSVPASPPVYHSPPRPEYCHTCGMELANSKDMKLHLEQHEFCPADDCDFAALHNILERHIEANHITGTYVKVKKVWTEEELAAWRAERRKKFPTAANVELARLAKEQRIKRGERLEASKSRFGNREDRQRTRPQGDHKVRFDPKNKKKRCAKGKANEKKKKQVGSANKSNDKANSASKQKETDEDKKEEEVTLCSLGNAKFGGTGQMPDYQHFKAKVQKKDNALSGFLGMYGSDSDEEDSEEETESDDQNTAACSKQVPAQVESSQSVPSEITEMGPAIAASNTPTSLENPQTCEDSTPMLGVTSSDQVPQEISNISEITPSNSEPAKEVGSSDEAPDEEPFQRVTETITASDPVKPPPEPLEPKPQTAPKRAAPKRIYGLNYKRARKQTPNTMLSKLLESDIRHERNVLLQCVRHVCERNFFGIGQAKSNQVTLNTTCDKSVDSTPDAL